MNELIGGFQAGLNQAGLWFCDYAVNISIQSGLLILFIYIVDLAIRRKVRAVFRYALWMLVLVKLMLPSTLSLPFGIGSWLGLVRGGGEGVAENIHGYVFLFWIFGVVFLCGLLIQRLTFIRRLTAQSREADAKTEAVFHWCKLLAGVEGDIRLRVSPNAIGPAICGLWKATILLPEYLCERLEEERLRVVLIHELVHWKRRDLWVSLLQTVLQIVHFYNPLLWFANASIRNVRELAADEAVLATMKNQPTQYSNVLLDIAEMAFSKPALGLRLLGVIESKTALNARILHMSRRPAPRNARLGLWGLLLVLLLGAVLLPMEAARGGGGDQWFKQPAEKSWKPAQPAGDWPE